MSYWRGLSDTEIQCLDEQLRVRKELPLAERSSVPKPDAYSESIAGTLWWTISVIWQDAPILVIFFLLALGSEIIGRAVSLLI